jgi:hypothetical protein
MHPRVSTSQGRKVAKFRYSLILGTGFAKWN